MQNKKQVLKNIFRGLAGVFGALLLLVGLAVFYTHQVSNQTLDRFLPSAVDYVVEFKPNALAEKIIKQKWGEQASKIIYQNGRIVSWGGQLIFCKKEASNIQPLETLDYRGFDLHNLLAGQGFWQVEHGGWVFESDQMTLRKLVDFWLSDDVSLVQNTVWQELKSSSTQGVLSLFILRYPDLKVDFWRGSSLVLQENSLRILTLLERTAVKDFAYGQSRERYTGSLLASADSNAWLVLGGQDLAKQFTQMSAIFSKSSPQILEWLKYNYSKMPMLTDGEQMLVWDSAGLQASQVPTDTPQNDFIAQDFLRYATGSERWTVLLYPQKNPQAQNLVEQVLGFVPRLIFVGGQAYDDRILTTLHFEK